MHFVTDVFEAFVGSLLAFITIVILVAVYGTSSTERYMCDLETDNAVANGVCILKTASN